MSKLTIVAHIEANSDKVEFIKEELKKLIEPTLKEKGCLNYNLHQDNEQPAKFLYFENWESRELWQDHMQSAHIQAFIKSSEGALKSFEVQEMTEV